MIGIGIAIRNVVEFDVAVKIGRNEFARVYFHVAAVHDFRNRFERFRTRSYLRERVRERRNIGVERREHRLIQYDFAETDNAAYRQNRAKRETTETENAVGYVRPRTERSRRAIDAHARPFNSRDRAFGGLDFHRFEPVRLGYGQHFEHARKPRAHILGFVAKVAVSAADLFIERARENYVDGDHDEENSET